MRSTILKKLTNKQLAVLANVVSMEQLFREYFRKQKWHQKHYAGRLHLGLSATEIDEVINED